MLGALLVLAFLGSVEPFVFSRAIYHQVVKMPDSSIIHPKRNTMIAFASTESFMEDGVTLNSLKDMNADGMFLKESIQRWLDEEYIPQDVHKDLGETVMRVYIQKRKEGKKFANLI